MYCIYSSRGVSTTILHTIFQIPDGSSGFYYLSVCASVGKQHSTACKSSGVCHVNAAGNETSFGDIHKAMISMKRDLVTLSYENKEKCNESSE